MGQTTRTDYLASNEHWAPDLPLAVREERWPSRPSYGLGRIDRAHNAVEAARQQAQIADQAFALVKQQAVYAALQEGLTVRATADITGIPKSEVGRIIRSIRDASGEHKRTTNALFNAPEVRRRVKDAWVLRG
ncbi:hypothetical protein ACR5MH_1040 (plasmid) [Streptomyces sp. L7]|uniref:hypothetical protein n=1 Tax=Streptomyces sp. L7 TaxID=3423954 RepID=UPI003899D466